MTCPAASAEAVVVAICISCALTSALPAIGAAMLVYSPYTGLTPASVADASPSGTLTTAFTNPATMSLRTVLLVSFGDIGLLGGGTVRVFASPTLRLCVTRPVLDAYTPHRSFEAGAA